MNPILRISRCLALLISLFPLLGYAQPVDNITYNFYCLQYNQVMFTATFSQNRSFVSLVDPNGETLQLPFWTNEPGIWYYGQQQEYFQFNPDDLSQAYFMSGGQAMFSDCYATNTSSRSNSSGYNQGNNQSNNQGGAVQQLRNDVGYEFSCAYGLTFVAVFSNNWYTLHVEDFNTGVSAIMQFTETSQDGTQDYVQPGIAEFSWNPNTRTNGYLAMGASSEYSNCTLTRELNVACPYVYISRTGDADDYEFIGEILRNVIGKGMETEQELVLPLQVDDQGVAHIRITEEKAETTYLDSVWLSVNGQTVQPENCASSQTAAYCIADKHYHVMELGDELELKFPVGQLKDGSTLEMRARGYYIPYPVVSGQ